MKKYQKDIEKFKSESHRGKALSVQVLELQNELDMSKPKHRRRLEHLFDYAILYDQFTNPERIKHSSTTDRKNTIEDTFKMHKTTMQQYIHKLQKLFRKCLYFLPTEHKEYLKKEAEDWLKNFISA